MTNGQKGGHFESGQVKIFNLLIHFEFYRVEILQDASSSEISHFVL